MRLLLLGFILVLCGCATRQTLQRAAINGRVVDGVSQAPIEGAKVAFVYWGPQLDWAMSTKDEVATMPSIEAGVVFTDRHGCFSAEIAERTTKRPLMDSWSPYPHVIVSKQGYKKEAVSHLSIMPTYNLSEGPPKFAKWPYTDDLVVKLFPITSKSEPKLGAEKETVQAPDP